MEIFQTTRVKIPENKATALSIIKGEIFKNINSGLYSDRNLAVAEALQDISYRFMNNGAEPILKKWFMEQLAECILKKKELPKAWEKVAFKAISYNVFVVVSDSHEDQAVINACLEWLGRKEHSFKLLRSDIGFFRSFSSPKHIQDVAKAFYYERLLDLKRPSKRDFMWLAAWAYEQGVKGGEIKCEQVKC